MFSFSSANAEPKVIWADGGTDKNINKDKDRSEGRRKGIKKEREGETRIERERCAENERYYHDNREEEIVALERNPLLRREKEKEVEKQNQKGQEEEIDLRIKGKGEKRGDEEAQEIDEKVAVTVETLAGSRGSGTGLRSVSIDKEKEKDKNQSKATPHPHLYQQQLSNGLDAKTKSKTEFFLTELLALLKLLNVACETNVTLKICKIIGLCTLFMSVGPSLILLNKYLLKDLHFNYPLFLSAQGLLFSGLLSHSMVFFNWVQLEHRDKMTTKFWVQNILPVGLCSAATLAFGNAAYLYLSVSFIQMLKAFSPVIVMLLAVIFQVDTPSLPIIFSLFIICSGTLLTSLGEANFHLLGSLLFVLAVVTEAVKLVITQKMITSLKFGIIEGQYALAPAGATCLLFLSFIWEFPTMLRRQDYLIIYQNPEKFISAAVMGIIIQFLTLLVIQITSSVTTKGK